MRNGKDEKWACKKMFCVNAWTLEPEWVTFTIP